MQLDLTDAERRTLETILVARRRELLELIADALKPNNGRREVPRMRNELARVEKILGALVVHTAAT